jgi:hypothetical protein
VSAPDQARAERLRAVIAEWNERGIEAIRHRWHEDIVTTTPTTSG